MTSLKRHRCGYCGVLRAESSMEKGDSVIAGKWRCVNAVACDERTKSDNGLTQPVKGKMR